MQDDDGDGPQTPEQIAEYVAEMAGQLAGLARRASLGGTETALLRAQVSALIDLRRLQAGKAEPEDAA